MHWQAVSHDTAFFVPVFWVKKLRSGDEFFTQNTKEWSGRRGEVNIRRRLQSRVHMTDGPGWCNGSIPNSSFWRIRFDPGLRLDKTKVGFPSLGMTT